MPKKVTKHPAVITAGCFVINGIALLDSAGIVVVKYVYDAWGNHAVLDANGNDISDGNHIGNLNPFRYRSYFYDVETELYYLQTRYYDPEVGRFITIDSIEYLDPESINGLNLYAYCGDNPVMRVDPTGTIFGWLLVALGILIGGVIAGTAAAINRTEGESIVGAFFGGVIDGIFGTIGVAMGLAIGGPFGFLVAAGISFIGGFLGNAVNQAISFGEVDWKIAAIQGGISAVGNSLAFIGTKFAGLTTGETWLKRFIDALKFSDIGIGISMFLTYYSFPNPNALKGKIHENSSFFSGGHNYFNNVSA